MKIAVQISGEFRALQTCWPKFEQHILNGFPGIQVDMFLHTWRQDNDSNPFLSTHGHGLATIQPRSYHLENYADRWDLHALPRSYSMFYSMKRANDARKEYEKLMELEYNLVIRYRTDCFLNEPLYQKILPFLQTRKSFLWIPTPTQVPLADGPTEMNEEESICDWFAVGTPDAMDVYFGTYDTWRPLEIPVVPESMLALQLKSRGITRATILKRSPFDIWLVKQDASKQSLKSPDESEGR